MLEKLFGKRSTGIVWIVTASILLLLLAGFVASYLLSETIDLYSLVGYAVFIGFALILITLPAFVQKKFKLYIPPFIQTGLCVYALLYLVNDLLPSPETNGEFALVQINFLPAVGGFFLCAAIFSVVYSLLRARADRKQRRLASWTVTLVAFVVTTLLLLLINLPSLFITLPPFSHGATDLTSVLINAAGYEFGAVAFCLTGWVTLRTGKSEWYTIRSFRNAERVKSEALRHKNRTLLTVVENMEQDATDYRKLYNRAKRQFYLARLVFLVFYAGYLVSACIGFYAMGGLGYALIAMNAAGFLLTAAVFFYEFFLFRKGTLNQRLRRLKIARTAIKLYTFLLTVTSSVAANANYMTLTALIAVIMAIVNLAVLFNNLFGKPRHYPAAPPIHVRAERQNTPPAQGAAADMAAAQGTAADMLPSQETAAAADMVPPSDAEP